MPKARKTDSRGFEIEVQAVLQRLQSAFGNVVSAIPGLRYERPNDLATELRLDPKLAWKIGRLVAAPDPRAALEYLPGDAAVKLFVRAAAARKAPSATLRTLEEAVHEFGRLVQQHAGSRKTLSMMLAGQSQAAARLAVEHRRAAFEGNSYIWGVQARTIFRTYIIHPSADPEMWDGVVLRGVVDLCCLRANTAWRFCEPHSVDDTHRLHTHLAYERLDPGVTEGPDLLPLFCSKPVPRFRVVTGVLGMRQYLMADGRLGHGDRTTCISGSILRAAEPRYRNPEYQTFAAACNVRTPAESLVLDLLVHPEILGRGPLQAHLYSDLYGGAVEYRYEPSDSLPLDDLPQYLGRGIDRAAVEGIPRYRELLAFALDRVGWSAAGFDLYRLSIPYPALNTTLMLQHELPDRAAAPRSANPGTA